VSWDSFFLPIVESALFEPKFGRLADRDGRAVGDMRPRLELADNDLLVGYGFLLRWERLRPAHALPVLIIEPSRYFAGRQNAFLD
jgi:hypothetical protein